MHGIARTRASLGAKGISLLLLGALACDAERGRGSGEGAHPAGWTEVDSPDFHATYLRAEGYPLQDCQACHGEDFGGGDVGISCSEGDGCHTRGLSTCEGTCHGDESSPLPTTGAHAVHGARYQCEDCHVVPDELLEPPHLSGVVNFAFSGLAVAGGREPSYMPGPGTCADVYCHQGTSPPWDYQGPLGCDGCHRQSPRHDRFDRVVSEETCANCHAGSPEVGHLDGEAVIAITGCSGCHGLSPATGAPPPGLDGSSDPSSVGVGAHRRHLDSLLPDRVGRVVACGRCHDIPGDTLDEGHIDSSAPADVDVILGSYDAGTRTCVVDCHFDKDPGPLWTDDSGAERQCDSCHDFPPTVLRSGNLHPTVLPDLDICDSCHVYSIATHVDGEVSFP